MFLCFDATRFGGGLEEAVDLAAARGLKAVEFSFAPFPVTGKAGKGLDKKERQHLSSIRERSLAQSVEFACLNLDYTVDPLDKKSMRSFALMVGKLAHVADAIGCGRLAFSIAPGVDDAWKAAMESEFPAIQEGLEQANVRPLLRLSTPANLRGVSLKAWRAMEPKDWRDLVAACPGLSLSFSPADCVWLGIDYLRILSGLASVIEHVEARDIEINRDLLTDSGMYGPLWWRYRLPGKGQVDWRQLIEALKLYDFQGSFSIQLDDEFVASEPEELTHALDSTVQLMSPLLRG